MASYWKSNPRHFCDFCKCWIADNKPSKDFHERGKKHQENVKRKINEVRKKGVERAQAKQEMDDSLKQMEEAALKAFKADLSKDPALAAQYGYKAKTEGPMTAAEAGHKPSKHKEQEKPKEENEKEYTKPPVKVTDWSEAQSPEGYTYYWNTATGETAWEKPEGYISPAERLQENQDKEESQDEKEIMQKKSEETPNPGTLSSIPLPGDLESIPIPEVKKAPKRHIPSAYGQWETIQTEKQVDLQLPIQHFENDTSTEAQEVVPEEPKIKFKEKKVTSLGPAGAFNKPVSFKKRKINSGARNIKKREEDDS